MKTEKFSLEFKTQESDARLTEQRKPGNRTEQEKRLSDSQRQDKEARGGCEKGEIPRDSADKVANTAEMLVSPANVLTSMRIGLSGVLLLLKPLSAAFYCVYALAGLTDMLDGAVARKTGTESRAGEMLDSAGDLVFAAAALVCLLPIYKEEIPFWLWAAVAFVIYLKVKNAIARCFMHGKIVTMHTTLNKLTGLALFALPFVCNWVSIAIYGGICAGLALAATIGAFIRSLQDSTKSGKRK